MKTKSSLLVCIKSSVLSYQAGKLCFPLSFCTKNKRSSGNSLCVSLCHNNITPAYWIVRKMFTCEITYCSRSQFNGLIICKTRKMIVSACCAAWSTAGKQDHADKAHAYTPWTRGSLDNMMAISLGWEAECKYNTSLRENLDWQLSWYQDCTMADEVMETCVPMVPVLSHATLEQYLEIPFKICNRDNVHVVLLW